MIARSSDDDKDRDTNRFSSGWYEYSDNYNNTCNRRCINANDDMTSVTSSFNPEQMEEDDHTKSRS